MKTIEKSGLCNPNSIAHVTLRSIEEIVGTNGLNAILKHAGLDELINNFPPKNWDKAFDFSYYTALNAAIHDIYGLRGGRVLAIRTGRATFTEMRNTYGAMVKATDIAIKLVPLKVKMTLWFRAMTTAFNAASDQQTSIEETENEFIYTVGNCPSCWGIENAEKPICSMQVGLIKQSLYCLSQGKEFNVYEATCHAMGDKACTFVIQKEPIGE